VDTDTAEQENKKDDKQQYSTDEEQELVQVLLWWFGTFSTILKMSILLHKYYNFYNTCKSPSRTKALKQNLKHET